MSNQVSFYLCSWDLLHQLIFHIPKDFKLTGYNTEINIWSANINTRYLDEMQSFILTFS